jgi:hypothetical protein
VKNALPEKVNLTSCWKQQSRRGRKEIIKSQNIKIRLTKESKVKFFRHKNLRSISLISIKFSAKPSRETFMVFMIRFWQIYSSLSIVKGKCWAFSKNTKYMKILTVVWRLINHLTQIAQRVLSFASRSINHRIAECSRKSLKNSSLLPNWSWKNSNWKRRRHKFRCSQMKSKSNSWNLLYH